MHPCDDLTEDEHYALTLMTANRNRRTGIVKCAVDCTQSCVDALIETGCVEQLDGGYYRVIDPCRGHRREDAQNGLSPADSRQHLRRAKPREYTGGAGYIELRAQSLGEAPGLQQIAPSSQAVPGEVRYAQDSASSSDTPRTPASRLLYHFNCNVQAYRWGGKLTKQGRQALGSNFKEWMGYGATENELHWVIEYFFERVDSGMSCNHLWRSFIQRRAQLADAYQCEQDYKSMEAHYGSESEYWSDAATVRRRQRAKLGLEARAGEQ